MAITIKTNASVNIEDSLVEVDTHLFSQRLIVSIQPEEINDAFSYKLCTRPSSLFDKKGLMNEAHKPELENALLDQQGLSECVVSDILQDTHYVLDGGSLLQRLPWTVASTFDEVCQSFKNYLLNNCRTAENITVVFDGGYLVPSIKNSTHIRRSKGRLGRNIVPSLLNPLSVKKVTFL